MEEFKVQCNGSMMVGVHEAEVELCFNYNISLICSFPEVPYVITYNSPCILWTRIPDPTPTPPSPTPTGMSSGAAAGYAIGSLLLVAVSMVAVWKRRSAFQRLQHLWHRVRHLGRRDATDPEHQNADQLELDPILGRQEEDERVNMPGRYQQGVRSQSEFEDIDLASDNVYRNYGAIPKTSYTQAHLTAVESNNDQKVEEEDLTNEGIAARYMDRKIMHEKTMQLLQKTKEIFN